MEHQPSEIERAALDIVRQERTAWDSSIAFVTDKVAFNMRNVIRVLRKNYWGVFEEPIDPITGKKKIWIPLTEASVEASVKNIDLDTRDIGFRARKAEAIGLTAVVRAAIRSELDRIGFAELLDISERDMAIDGTFIWRTDKTIDEDGKPTVKVSRRDLLNIYIDPTAPSIQDAYRFTERGLYTVEEVKANKDWLNTSDIQPSLNLARYDASFTFNNSNTGTTKMVDVWEMYGAIPQWLITGKTKDQAADNQEIEGHIIISGLDKAGSERVHLVERFTKKWRPYEECWYTRIGQRWYGKGIAEKLMALQLWLNLVINNRINKNSVASLGLFKIKRGAGITPQMLARLASNGGILINDQADIEQFIVNEAGAASYQEEQSVYDWSQKVTSLFDSAVGDSLPASTPATNAAISNNNAKSQFTLVKEGIGTFLQRWLTRHVLPVIQKRLTAGEIIRLTGETDEINTIFENVVNRMVADALDKLDPMAGQFVDPDQVEFERQRAIAQLQASGKDVFIKLEENADLTQYDVEVDITNEEIDKAVLAQNLTAALQAAPQFSQSLIAMILDLSGLDAKQLKPNPPQAQPQQPGQGQQMQPQSQMQPVATQANTMNG